MNRGSTWSLSQQGQLCRNKCVLLHQIMYPDTSEVVPSCAVGQMNLFPWFVLMYKARLVKRLSKHSLVTHWILLCDGHFPALNQIKCISAVPLMCRIKIC